MAAGASSALNMSQNDTISTPSTQEAFDHKCCKKYRARAVCPPRRGRSADSPNTFLTSSTSNSRVEPLVHVLSLTVNQFCHDFDGGRPRSPVGNGHLGEPETGDVRFPIRTQRRREVVRAVPSRQLPPKRLAALAAPPAATARSFACLLRISNLP